MVLLSPRRKKDTILSNKPADSWLVLDQTFFSLFKMFSLIELAHIGAGLIDGLIASNFLDAQAMAALGIAHPIFSITGIFAGMFATGMQTLCTRALGRGDLGTFNRLFSAVMILGTGFSLLMAVLLFLAARRECCTLFRFTPTGKRCFLCCPAGLKKPCGVLGIFCVPLCSTS